jgi:hypothetical protein
MSRIRVAAMVAVVVGLAFPVAGFAQTQYGGGTLTVIPTTLTAGQAFTASGSGYAPSSPVTITFASDPVVLANVTTNAVGSFTANLAVPTNATPGTHTVAASGKAPDNSARILTATVTVVATGSGAKPLVRTGPSNIGPMIMWGLLLIVVGFVVVVAVRRTQFRRQRSSWS